jgi:hypothetical protein
VFFIEIQTNSVDDGTRILLFYVCLYDSSGGFSSSNRGKKRLEFVN